ncbi:MAG TPA: hypothetical protein PLI95_29985, partial [Polyangiaceae bacterium]|nr:hypothetical protein [Polyangiaceae bacterium]
VAPAPSATSAGRRETFASTRLQGWMLPSGLEGPWYGRSEGGARDAFASPGAAYALPRPLLYVRHFGFGTLFGWLRVSTGREVPRRATEGPWDSSPRRLDLVESGSLERPTQVTVGAGATLKKPDSWLPSVEANTRLEAHARRDLDGQTSGRSARIGSTIRLTNDLRLSAAVNHRPSFYDWAEMGDGTGLQRSRVTGAEAAISTDPASALFARLWAQAQNTSAGHNLAAEATLSLRPARTVELDVVPQVYATSGEPRSVGRDELYGTWLFGRLDARNVGATVRGTWAFDRRVTVQSHVQVYHASGSYSDYLRYDGLPGSIPRIRQSLLESSAVEPVQSPDYARTVVNFNLVVRWEYRPGCSFFAVYGRSQSPFTPMVPWLPSTPGFAAKRGSPAADVVMLKLVHWWG